MKIGELLDKVPPECGISLAKYSITETEIRNARNALLLAIKSQVKKQAKEGNNAVGICPCQGDNLVQGYQFSKQRSSAVYSAALLQLRSEGRVLDIRWGNRGKKRVVTSFSVPCEKEFHFSDGKTASVGRSTAFDLLMKNKNLPPWVHRWAKKMPSSYLSSAKLLDSYFELLERGERITERTLSCYAFADSKAVGAPGDNLISAFICFCPCLSNALKSCSDAWEQLGMLGIERNSGAIMVSGPIALFGKKGEVVDASASGKYGVGVSAAMLVDICHVDVSKAQGCLLVENEANYRYASGFLHNRVVSIYCQGQPSNEAIKLARMIDLSMPLGMPRRVWQDIDPAGIYGANRLISEVHSFRTLMMGLEDLRWLQQNYLLKSAGSELTSFDKAVLSKMEKQGYVGNIDSDVFARVKSGFRAEQEAFIGSYAHLKLEETFPEVKGKSKAKKSSIIFAQRRAMVFLPALRKSFRGLRGKKNGKSGVRGKHALPSSVYL